MKLKSNRSVSNPFISSYPYTGKPTISSVSFFLPIERFFFFSLSSLFSLMCVSLFFLASPGHHLPFRPISTHNTSAPSPRGHRLQMTAQDYASLKKSKKQDTKNNIHDASPRSRPSYAGY